MNFTAFMLGSRKKGTGNCREHPSANRCKEHQSIICSLYIRKSNGYNWAITKGRPSIRSNNERPRCNKRNKESMGILVTFQFAFITVHKHIGDITPELANNVVVWRALPGHTLATL